MMNPKMSLARTISVINVSHHQPCLPLSLTSLLNVFNRLLYSTSQRVHRVTQQQTKVSLSFFSPQFVFLLFI